MAQVYPPDVFDQVGLCWKSGFEFCVTVGDEVPIDHLPEGANILRPAVLIFEIIGVLPDMQAEKRMPALANRRVLRESRRDGERASSISIQPEEPDAVC